MKTYGELNLKDLREKADLDFAHFTYGRGQCSCCYGPWDMPDRYWAKGKKPKLLSITNDLTGQVVSETYAPATTSVQYILFKNACNGSGAVTSNDTICVFPAKRRKHHWTHTYRVYIEWQFPMEKMDTVLTLLREQLDDDYIILKPQSECECITIMLKEDAVSGDDPQIFHSKKNEQVD